MGCIARAGRRRFKVVLLGSAAALLFVGGLSASAYGAAYQLDGLGASCVEPGNSNTVHGNGFLASSDVAVVLGSDQIGVLEADAGGVVDGVFTVPSNAPTGSTTLQLVGTGGKGPRSLSFTLQVGGCSGAGTETAGNTGALALTGGNTGMTVGIGAAAIVLGSALFAASRRKKSPVADNAS